MNESPIDDVSLPYHSYFHKPIDIAKTVHVLVAMCGIDRVSHKCSRICYCLSFQIFPSSI